MEHLDFLIVGAGLSGIAAARALLADDSTREVALFESRDASGGTWDLFRYPGIRSDSDMTTFGYRDKPWTDPRAIAPGGAILDYLRDAAVDAGVTPHMRFGHRVTRVDWSSTEGRWTVDFLDGTAAKRMTCSFLLLCTGYYRYDEGFRPDWPGLDSFMGELVHPQHWPANLEYADRRIVVVGSGATAITLVPALAARGARVTMLQRSPGYIAALPAVDRATVRIRNLFPSAFAEWLNRWRSIAKGVSIYAVSKRFPAVMRRLLRKGVAAKLPQGYDIDRHFTPKYDPWDQRLCVAPNGDFFDPIREGRAEVVTDAIDTFTPTGIRLASGRELDADVIVTATGLNLLIFGSIEIAVDGKRIEPRETVSYRGMMLAGVPNLVFAIGYTNASWTLKIDLVVRHFVSLLRVMRKDGFTVVTPTTTEAADELRPLIDLEAGYIQRGLHLMPKQSDRAGWRVNQNYFADNRLFRASISRGNFTFGYRP